ncbi:class F sortase [Naasia sp. SYSU D00057]|uniref:class F sortase n=1 Tax=Naasia sp. SYSU D00057 TaxID=2817380 RepID=UPI001B300861|nr:class F sortase [Naasia sp. SYSU D00057]
MSIRTAVVLSSLLLLSGCTGVAPSTPVPAAEPAPAIDREPTVTPAPRPTAAGEVPIFSTRLPSPDAPVPPVRVRVPSVDVEVDVIPVGVRKDTLMELPEDVSVAGWYRYGSDPTTGAGTTVIAAHVDSLEYGLGPFARLKGAAAGAEIVVTTVDGAEHRYAIEGVSSVRKEDLPVNQIFDRAGPERLVLITCGGQFDREALRYSDNVLVTAVPVE